MTVSNTLLDKASAFVSQRFEGSVKHNVDIYHDLNHTKETVAAGRQIAEGMGLPEQSVLLVMLACWFHDIGHIESVSEHEEKSAEIAGQFLLDEGIDPETADIVKGCILSTKIPQGPLNGLQEIVCDADLSHLGSDNYSKKNELLRIEFEQYRNKPYTDIEWLQLNIDFFQKHSFFTRFARENLNGKKEENLAILQNELKKARGRKKQEKEAKKKNREQLENAAKNRGIERNMEVYYRTSSRNHVSFSAIVDQKANIMIQTNSLIFSIIISLLVRKLDQLPDLILPTFLMLFTCVATIITSVLATRPKVTRHETTMEDISNRKANLLFFGSFVNLDLDQYEWGVKEMLKDKPYYINNMIRDTYYLGKVLDKKYKFLKLSYDIFMIGLILSISLYAYAFTN